MAEPESEAHRLVGAVLAGKYRLEQLLGEGGVGAVFRATTSAGGTVAIKVLHPEFRDNDEIVRRFFDEATIAARLQHPGVVQVYEASQAEDGTPFLAMELLVGRPLSDALQVSGALPIGFASTLLSSALDALHYAHLHGVIHRDLKPENLFVMTPPSGPPTLKIVDFGIAKVMDAAGGMGTRTRTGMLMGTPAYMSPEQLRDSKAVDARSDLWSMAVIIYEMLTGKEPFYAENPMQQIHLVLGTTPPPVAQHQPALAPLQPFFDRGMARDPALRFPSATAMNEALGAFARALESGLPPPLMAPLGSPGHVVSPEALAATVPPITGGRPASVAPPPMAEPSSGVSSISGVARVVHGVSQPGAPPPGTFGAPAVGDGALPRSASLPPPGPGEPPASYPAAGLPPPGSSPSLAPIDERVTSPGTSGRKVAVIVLVVLAMGLLVVAAIALVIAMR